MGRSGVERSRVLGGTHYVGWVRLRPRLGYEREFAQLVSLSPHVVLEAHRLGDRLEFYAWIRDIALPLLRRRASVEPVEQPPELRQKWMAELRAPSGAWETGVEASEAWLSVYDWLEDGEVVQVVGFYDARIHRELAKKARHYRLGERPELKGLGPLEYHKKDPDRARTLAQLSARRIYVTAVRFYSSDKGRARELGERAAGLFTPALKVRVSKRGDPGKLRDPMSLMGRFSPKKEYPWIPQESFMHLMRLPRPDEVSARLDFARGAALPQVAPRLRGPCVRLGELESGEEYCLPLEELRRHAWVIGQTGSGKSTFLWNLSLRLLEKGQGAVVVIDPHGDLAFDILESAPSLDRVYLLDPTRKPFGLNPLDLPRLPDRGQAVALAVDHLLTIFEKVLRLPETAVNVRYLLQVLLRFMYERMDSPTLGDIYAAIVALYQGQLDLPVDDPEWRVQVEALQRLQDQTFLSALSRLEPFANHPVLRRVTSRTTVPLEEVLRPGSLVLIRLPKGELGESVLRLLAPAIVLRLWFYVLERAARGEERTPIYVVVDEFQNLAGLPVVETILSEARKYGLHLVMAHQHTRQIPEELLQSVFSNTGVKVVFRVGGSDLEKLKALDPEFAGERGPAGGEQVACQVCAGPLRWIEGCGSGRGGLPAGPGGAPILLPARLHSVPCEAGSRSSEQAGSCRYTLGPLLDEFAL